MPMQLRMLPLLAALAWVQFGDLSTQQDILAADHAEAQRLTVDHALEDLARSSNTQAFAAQLDQLSRDRRHRESVRTILLHDGLVTLAELPPVPELETWLHALALQDRNLTASITDEGHAIQMPVYDIGAAARYALAGWSRQRAQAKATVGLQTGAPDLSRAYGPGSHASQRNGYARAFSAATDAELAGARAAVVDAFNAGMPVEALAATIAVRLRDHGVATMLMERGDGRAVLSMLNPLLQAFPDQDAFALARTAAQRPDIGSAAIAEIGGLSDRVPGAQDWLLQQLGDRNTGSAAALALAGARNPGLIPQLEYELNAGREPLRRSRAALTLQLNGSEAARAALQRFAEGARPDDPLRGEVQQWLR